MGTAAQAKQHPCRTIELKDMFHSLANAVRLKGKNAVTFPIDGGMAYRFQIGDNICTYSFTTKGGVL